MIKKIARCCLCRKPILDIEAYAVIVGEEVQEINRGDLFEKIEGNYCHQRCLVEFTKKKVDTE